jgi:hypothetical protein
MKTKNILLAGLFAVGGVMTACSDFTEINEDPNQVNEDKVQPQWLFNNSVIEAQMNPEIAERIFILKWNAAARFNRLSGFTIGSDNNDYNTLYLSTSYAIGWLNTATKAVQFAEKRINSGVAYPYESNIMQMARIWRAYLMAEVTDCFGPIPSVADSFDGDPTPSYSDEKSIYEYILTELAEAQGKLDTSIDMSDVKDEDAFYAGDVSMWQKYANSLRMRYAMRISNVDADFAKAQFVAASALPFISEQADIASVQERSGWSALTGVMTREWNGQQMSVTYKNLVEGLGDCEFSIGGVALPDSVAENVKNPRTYMGEYIPTQFPTTTNDPCAGYFFDGIPKYVDPRAPLTFCVVGWNDGTVYPSSMVKASNVVPVKLGAPDPADSIVINPKYTWTTCVAGIWDTKSAYSSNYIKNLNLPLIAQKYRTSELKRVFFGPWESYFLIAEAALNGWNVGMTAEEAYENGIEASFTYMGVPDSELANYLESTSYNRVGTSVAWNHTTEAQSYQTTYTDPYDGNALKTVTYNYPKNSIYKNGTVNNDQLTKILTQKYIAQVPWLPLEAWADHRRLGLPFFENQAVEIDYNTTNYLPLTVSQSKECKLEFYPKRFAYPATLKTVNNEGYKQALQLLGGIDKASTPLWWCLK